MKAAADFRVPGEVRRDGATQCGHPVAGFLGKCVHHAAWRFRQAEYAWSFVEHELASRSAVPRRTRWSLWKRGFHSEAAIIYRFADHDPDLYLSDYARNVKTRQINGAYGVLLDDKLLFARMLRDHARHLPTVFGTIRGGRIVPVEGVSAPVTDATLSDLLHRVRELVLKPVAEGGGRGVTVLRADGGDSISVNGSRVGTSALERIERACDGYLVSEYVRQHPVVAALYPETANTARIVTMRDNDGVFIAATILRIGRECSRPTDNWSRGGMTAAIDLGSGRLGRAASFLAEQGRLEWHTRHPETGSPIEGTELPHWDMVTSAILRIAASLPFLSYIGWDVAITEDGFRILEGNKYTDVQILQVHRPLLVDRRIVSFYRTHGVVGGPPPAS